MKCVTVTSKKCNNRQMTLPNKYGFPRTNSKGSSKSFGFSSGDLIKAIVTKGKYIGTYIGIVAIRSSGYFQLDTTLVKYTDCKLLQKNDNYKYQYGTDIKTTITHELATNVSNFVNGRYKILKNTITTDKQISVILQTI